jgi:hypothetical protein
MPYPLNDSAGTSLVNAGGSSLFSGLSIIVKNERVHKLKLQASKALLRDVHLISKQTLMLMTYG